MIEFMEHDDCCSKRFAAVGRAGTLADADSWTCPKCGCEWRASDVADTAKTWTPVVTADIIRVRG